jgi:hypothetical protein
MVTQSVTLANWRSGEGTFVTPSVKERSAERSSTALRIARPSMSCGRFFS